MAPHALTLRPATDEAVHKLFHTLEYRDPGTLNAPDRFDIRDGRLYLRSAVLPDAVPIDWVFGSGKHARTPVTVINLPDGKFESIEHRLSWYPQFGIDLTLGAPQRTTLKPGWHGLGKRLNPDDAADCFGCHSSWLPTNHGRLDLSRIRPGIECSRCHQESELHIQSASRGAPQLNQPRWSDLSPLESIRRCGECHRRDDQMTPFELKTSNPLLIRFAPAGLSQSRCFTLQDQVSDATTPQNNRLDCMTCHDPHRAAESSQQYYVDRCLACHTDRLPPNKDCQTPSRSGRCLECHMPKIEVQSHLHFTDHWIRRRPEKPFVENP